MKRVTLLLEVATLIAAVWLIANWPEESSSPKLGNVPTYSGNGNGNFTGDVMHRCADVAVAMMREDPKADGDELFQICYRDVNGVKFI